MEYTLPFMSFDKFSVFFSSIHIFNADFKIVDIKQIHEIIPNNLNFLKNMSINVKTAICFIFHIDIDLTEMRVVYSKIISK